MDESYENQARIFRALSDPNRLKILDLLRDGEKCACALLEMLQITQPTLSHHMKALCDADLVVVRKDGRWMNYSISAQGSKAAVNLLCELTSAAADTPPAAPAKAVREKQEKATEKPAVLNKKNEPANAAPPAPKEEQPEQKPVQKPAKKKDDFLPWF